MMLPGVELARKRRVHNRLDGWARSSPPDPTSSSARLPFSLRSPPIGMDESARAARLRLEEKLRGIICTHQSSPSADSPSRGGQSRWIGDRSRASTVDSAAGADRVATGTMPNPNQYRLLERSGSRVDLCAVCLEALDEVEARQRVTCLPCSHKYHTECLVPWLAAHSHCPCCRTHVPALGLLS